MRIRSQVRDVMGTGAVRLRLEVVEGQWFIGTCVCVSQAGVAQWAGAVGAPRNVEGEVVHSSDLSVILMWILRCTELSRIPVVVLDRVTLLVFDHPEHHRL